jgi:hypothetical protein
MTDDLLKRASRALREETADAEEGARFTRARVLSSLQQSQVRSRARLAVLLPIAACFAAATAFGMVDGRAPAFVRSLGQALGLSEASPPSSSKPPKAPAAAPAASAPSTAPTPAELAPLTPLEAHPEAAPPEVAPPAPAEVAAPAELTPRGSSSARATPRGNSSSRARPSSSSESSAALTSPEPQRDRPGDVSDRAHELYRVAHRTHFVDQDFVSALRAWDAYLEAAPKGRFVLEARYNRALCLVRLGRTGDARAALEPFASGTYSGYREAEARALIEALSK